MLLMIEEGCTLNKVREMMHQVINPFGTRHGGMKGFVEEFRGRK